MAWNVRRCFQSPCPLRSLQPSLNASPAFVLPPHFHLPFTSLFPPATRHGSAAKERAEHHWTANVWGTGLVSRTLERGSIWQNLAKTPYRILKYPLVLAYRKRRHQTWQMSLCPGRQIHPETTPWGRKSQPKVLTPLCYSTTWIQIFFLSSQHQKTRLKSLSDLCSINHLTFSMGQMVGHDQCFGKVWTLTWFQIWTLSFRPNSSFSSFPLC